MFLFLSVLFSEIQYHGFYTYKFNLDERLRLNLTLQRIYFSVHTYLYCQGGYIGVRHKNILVRYCGVISQISSYSQSNDPTIEVRTYAFVTVNVHMSFTIMDHRLIETWSCEKTYESVQTSYPTIIQCPSKGIYLSSLHIKVEHYRHLVVLCNMSQHQVKTHDGPGKRSAPLRKLDKVQNKEVQKFLSSTHQVVIFYVSQMTIQKHSTKHMNFYSESDAPLAVDVGHNSTTWILPNTAMCNKSNSCILKLQARNAHVLNLTLNAWEYQGIFNTENCSFAGLAIYDKFLTSFHLINTFCVRHHHARSFHRGSYVMPGPRGTRSTVIFVAYNATCYEHDFPRHYDTKTVYSTSDTVMVALYFYKEYGTMTLNLIVRTTECKIISLDICKLPEKLLVVREFPKAVREGEMPREQVSVVIPWDLPCVVLQIYPNSTGSSRRIQSCRRNFYLSDKVMRSNQRRSFMGTGFLTGTAFTLVQAAP